MAYSEFFHIKKAKDGVELRFLKTIIDTVDCVINKKTIARGDSFNTYDQDRHNELPTIQGHFNIEYGDVLYVSRMETIKKSGWRAPLIAIVYKQGKDAEIIYYSEARCSNLENIVLDTFCMFRDNKMIPLDSSMFKADVPNISKIKWDAEYLFGCIHDETIDKYSCKTYLNRAENIYKELFLNISNQCI